MATNLCSWGALASALVLAGCAASGGNVKPAAQSVAGSQPCVPQTGSRIAAENTDGAVVASCYTSTDISRTGNPNSAQALQMLDPAVRVGH